MGGLSVETANTARARRSRSSRSSLPLSLSGLAAHVSEEDGHCVSEWYAEVQLVLGGHNERCQVVVVAPVFYLFGRLATSSCDLAL